MQLSIFYGLLSQHTLIHVNKNIDFLVRYSAPCRKPVTRWVYASNAEREIKALRRNKWAVNIVCHDASQLFWWYCVELCYLLLVHVFNVFSRLLYCIIHTGLSSWGNQDTQGRVNRKLRTTSDVSRSCQDNLSSMLLKLTKKRTCVPLSKHVLTPWCRRVQPSMLPLVMANTFEHISVTCYGVVAFSSNTLCLVTSIRWFLAE
jgi:hypothetical protein